MSAGAFAARLGARLGIGRRAAHPRRSFADRLDDWPNPVVVKELRQAVNGRFAGVVLLTLLGLQLGTIALALLVDDNAAQRRNFGRELFTALQGVLFFATVLALPLYAGARVLVERAGNHLDLLYATTLPPRVIVRGKLQAAALLAALLYAASLPLMSLSYLLRGIDLPSMAAVLAGTYLVVVNAIFVAVAVGCLPTGRVVRVLAALAFVGLLLIVGGAVLAIAGSAIGSGIGARFSRLAVWGAAGALLLLDLLALRLLFLLTVAMVSPPAGNRALPVRRYALLLWAVTFALAVWTATSAGASWPVRTWALTATWGVAAVLLAATGARDTPPAALVKALPRHPLRRAVSFLCSSGAAGGFGFAVVWVLATAIATWLAALALPPAMRVDPGLPRQVLALGGYLLGYGGVAAWLVRGPLRRWVPAHHGWALTLALGAIGSSFPPLVAYLLDPRAFHLRSSFGYWLLPNPLALFQGGIQDAAAVLGIAAGAAVVALGLRWWLRTAAPFFAPAAAEPVASPQPT